MTFADVYANRVKIRYNGDGELVDHTDRIGLLLFRAPNRYRKFLKTSEYDKAVSEAVALQLLEFPTESWAPIGFQATMDNDWAIAWNKKNA